MQDPRSHPTTTRLYLVRHGETEWNRAGLYQGTTDVPLNATGRAQAAELARRLAGVQWGGAYTSPLQRARETAEAVLGECRVPLVELPELRELCYGLWQGRGSAPRGRCNAGLEWRWREDPWSVRFPGGEGLPEVRERARAVLARLRDAHPAGTVLVSGHGHMNRVLLIEALALPPERFWSLEQENGCCTVLELGPQTATWVEAA